MPYVIRRFMQHMDYNSWRYYGCACVAVQGTAWNADKAYSIAVNNGIIFG